ncbi:diacylglycerol kinase [Halovulum dunhuangense]|uniref:Diacylglycerol kinase n=1 Tax=Halovulum dunhuangense TaxID=1505036 RepID=A0A849KYS3_9RHOB|nr:diacylglycerol kinase [Halovulum dunhuangense]NNU79456.1 diacylglycerol kinase [Halovulum dunhuangense]
MKPTDADEDLPRLVQRKLHYSIAGLRETWKSEPSFRQWTALVAASDLAALALMDGAALALVLVLGFLLLAAELGNTAIEAVTDKASPDHHPLAAKAKDAASAMVFVTFVALATAWLALLLA